jgi:hypothetical protein
MVPTVRSGPGGRWSLCWGLSGLSFAEGHDDTKSYCFSSDPLSEDQPSRCQLASLAALLAVRHVRPEPRLRPGVGPLLSGFRSPLPARAQVRFRAQIRGQ